MDVNIDSFEPQTTSDYLKYLMAVTYSKNKENIDFNTLCYIQTLNSKLKTETSISDLMEMINKDIENNDEKRESFIKRKEESGEKYTTSGFDRKNTMYSELLKQLDSKINLKGNPKQIKTVNTQRLGKETLNEMQDINLIDETQRYMEAQQKELERTKEKEEIQEDKDV